MSAPQPDNLPPQSQNIIESLIEAFKKLPALLSYGGLVLIVFFIFAYFIGDFPDILLAIPLVAIIAFLIYAFMERRFDLQLQQIELQKQAQELTHVENVLQIERDNPAAPQPQAEPSPVTPEEETTPKEWQRRYLEHLLKICGYPPSMALVDIKEAGLGGHKLELERIFTSLDVPAPQKGHDLSLSAMAGDGLEEGKRLEREPALAAISRTENKKLVLLGAPGSGKSTLVNYVTLCLVGDRLAGEHGEDSNVTQDELRQYGWELSHLRLWPVRIILREYAARGLAQGQGIWEFIAADLSRLTVGMAGYVPLLKKRLQAEGGLLLLDGLDEVEKATAVRTALKNNIELFARNYGKVRIVVTSRPYAYGSGWELNNFKVTRLLSFSDEQIHFFIEQWYKVMSQQDAILYAEDAEAYSQSLNRQIEKTDSLRQMARHPLLLTMMVYIHRGREGGELPQRREKLYRLSVTLLLDLWRRSKTVLGEEAQELADTLGMDAEQLQKALAEVAFDAHREQRMDAQTADISGKMLVGTLLKYKGKTSMVYSDDLIEYVRDRAGLLEDHGKNADGSDDVYRFPHRTFQEYLAAMYLLNKPDFPKELVALARQNPAHWREVVLLAGAAAQTTLQWGLIEALTGYRTADNAGGEADWWGAFLAGQVIAENETLALDADAPQEKVARVRAWQEALVVQGMLPVQDRALAGQALALLGDTRPGVGVIVCDGVVLPDILWGEEVPAGTYVYQKDKVQITEPFRLACYPITNGQFQCFVDAADGHDGAWWQGIPDKEREFSDPAFPYANHPRERVSWYQAVAFCRWLSAHLDEEIRLPREVEWEVAARYPDGVSYPWGNTFDSEKANTDEGGVGQTTAVGSYPAGKNSALNLYDLSGNVWEWCANKYKTPDDVAVDRSNDTRVLRGGSWYDFDNPARAASRYSLTPGPRHDAVGFRVVVVRRSPSYQDH